MDRSTREPHSTVSRRRNDGLDRAVSVRAWR
jgi:hypothetical protein